MDFPGECLFVVFDFFAHPDAPPGLKTPKIFFYNRNKVIMLVIGNIPCPSKYLNARHPVNLTCDIEVRIIVIYVL